MTEFQYQPMFPLGEDATVYDCLTPDFVKVDSFSGPDVVRVKKC
jgi:fumarate hydratase class I